MTEYFKPRSLTFWSGAVLVISGIMEATGSAIPGVSEVVRSLIADLYGASDPGARISLGLGLIGIRRALGL